MGEIRFIGTGETHGHPYLVCKKTVYISTLDHPERPLRFLITYLKQVFTFTDI